MQWHQNYSALGGNLLLTAVVVAIPIFYLFWALAIQRMNGYLAGVSTLLITIGLTIIVYRMPVSASLAAAGLGMTTGLFPIGWIILREWEDVTNSELQQGSGTQALLALKVRPEAFPTGSPMSISPGFLQYLGYLSLYKKSLHPPRLLFPRRKLIKKIRSKRTSSYPLRVDTFWVF